MTSQLYSWADSEAKRAIVDFATRVTTEGGPDFVPPAERVAVFDNDGTLWCEKPMPIELGFILMRLASMAERDAALRERQPWKAAHEKDYAWLGGVITNHYAGDDTDVKVLMAGILQAFAGTTVDDYAAAAHSFLTQGDHPTLSRRLCDCGFRPMVELLRYLEEHGFMSATRRAEIGSRGFALRSCRAYGKSGITAVIRLAEASLAAWIITRSSIRFLSTGGQPVWTRKTSAPRIDSS